MLNIVVPMAGVSSFFDTKRDGFPKVFFEICGRTMLELFVENFSPLKNKRFIFIAKEEDNDRFGIDEALRNLAGEQSLCLCIKNETQGMLCTAMLAAEHIENDTPLLIVNCDQIFNERLDDRLEMMGKFDAGVLSFESIHPRYAYVLCDASNLVLQAFEKKPVSKNAVAGFYYFKSGKLFMEAAKNTIRKENHFEGKFFIAPALNELILKNKKVLNIPINKDKYFTFYSPKKIEEYERLRGGGGGINGNF